MDPRTSSLESNIFIVLICLEKKSLPSWRKYHKELDHSYPGQQVLIANSEAGFLGDQLIGKKNELCGSGQPPFNNNYLSFLYRKLIICFFGIIWLSHDHGEGTGFLLCNIKQKLSFKMLKLKAWPWTLIARGLDIRRELMDLRRCPLHSPPRVL